MKNLIPQFETLVGFREDDNYENLITDLDSQSDSGLYFQDVHPLLSLTNLKSIAPMISDNEMTDEQFLRWLHSKKDAAILKVLLAVKQNRNLNRVDKKILDKSLIYNGAGNINDKEVKESRFVGFQIVVKNTDQLTLVLNQVCLQISTPQDLDLYFYHSSQPSAVFVKSYSAKEANMPNWIPATDLEFICSASRQFGGFWTVGYYEDDLVGQGLNKSGFNFIRGGCNCNGFDPFRVWNPHVSIQPIFVLNSNLTEDRSRPMESVFVYPSEKTFGLNFMFSVVCSLADIITDQKAKYSQAIALQFGVDMLQEIAFTTRTASLTEKIQQKAVFDLEDKEGSIGLKGKLELEKKSVSISLEKLGPLCLPSFNRINYSTL